MMRNGISSRLGYVSFVLLLITRAGAAEPGTPAVAEVPVAAAPAETSIKGLCPNAKDVGKVIGVEFSRAIKKRKALFGGTKMKLELVISPAGFVNQARVLEVEDEELGQLALITAGLLQCRATGRTVTTIYPYLFEPLDAR